MTERVVPRLTLQEFEALARRVSNWGRWGADDQLGTLHFLTPDRRRSAAALIRDGVAVSCARDLDSEPRHDAAQPTLHRPYWVCEHQTGVGLEILLIEPHGWTITHLDALNHMQYRDRMYNDRPVSHFCSDDQSVNSVMAAREGICGRGVLIDLPPVLGKDWMEPGEVATREDVDRALARQAVAVQPGDILLVRTGRTARDRVLGRPPISAGLAGLCVTIADWLHASEVASVITDVGMDPQPSQVDQVRVPWHVLTLVMMGLMITDNADLEQLARECAQRKRWEFFVTLCPLRIPNGNSSPVNPIAIL
jgi:kynurenine formamidase